tara:strand:+ start:554 stop:817 length:264 start_codon:yes stop_codon:yes gene_type:complete
MKTITRNDNKVSKYLLEDGVQVNITTEDITIGDPENVIIVDLNSSNATLHTDVTNAPDDYVGNKYIYEDTAWSVNPDYRTLEDFESS